MSTTPAVIRQKSQAVHELSETKISKIEKIVNFMLRNKLSRIKKEGVLYLDEKFFRN